MMASEKEQKIVEKLEGSEHGLTINELAEAIGLYRATVAKYLLLLESQGVVSMRKIGPAKVYFLKKSVKEKVEEKLKDNETSKKKDWIDSLISDIKSEVKGELK